MTAVLIERFCRVCFKFYTPNEEFLRLDECRAPHELTFKEKLKCVIPEIILDDRNQYVVCKLCSDNLNLSFTFHQLCKETEVKFSHLKSLDNYTHAHQEDVHDLLQECTKKNATNHPSPSSSKTPTGRSDEIPGFIQNACATLPELRHHTPESLQCFVQLAPIDVVAAQDEQQTPPTSRPLAHDASKAMKKEKVRRIPSYIDPPFNCRKCDYGTNTKKRLQSHMRKEHKPNYRCKRCKKGFYGRSQYTTHTTKRCLDGGDDDMEDDVDVALPANKMPKLEPMDEEESGAGPQRSSPSKKHATTEKFFQRIHGGKKLYYCSLCNRYYKTKDHVNSHTFRKPYRCDKCETRFSHRTSKVRHMKKQHAGEDALLVMALTASVAEEDEDEEETMMSQEYSEEVSSTTQPQPPPELCTFTCQICKVLVFGKAALVGHMGQHVQESQKLNEVADQMKRDDVLEVCFDIKEDLTADYC